MIGQVINEMKIPNMKGLDALEMHVRELWGSIG